MAVCLGVIVTTKMPKEDIGDGMNYANSPGLGWIVGSFLKPRQFGEVFHQPDIILQIMNGRAQYIAPGAVTSLEQWLGDETVYNNATEVAVVLI